MSSHKGRHFLVQGFHVHRKDHHGACVLLADALLHIQKRSIFWVQHQEAAPRFQIVPVKKCWFGGGLKMKMYQ